MLKFIKHNMETIIGIELFPLISFIIFFGFFVGLLIFVKTMKKSHVDTMGHLPLEDYTAETPSTPHEKQSS